MHKYFGVAYVTDANPELSVMQFDSLDGVRTFLARPENLGQKWAFYELAREIPYRSEIAVTLEVDR